MTTGSHALVIGGSVGGLLATSFLRQIGWTVTVFERTEGDLTGRGAGLGMSEELMQALRRIGAPFEPSMGAVHESYVWIDADGRVVYELPRPTAGSTWSRVYRPLRDIVPNDIYRQGMALARVEQDARSVTAIFADGVRVTADLLVAADGVFSTVRRQLAPTVEPRYAGYVAWRGIMEERDLPKETLHAVDGRIVFCFPEGEMLLSMPVPGPGEDMRPGHRQVYFIWYRPADEHLLRDLFTDATGRHHGVSIPPPLIRPDHVSAMKAHARDVLPSQIAAVVNGVAQPLLQAISDMESQQLAFGRVAILGDAAFIARPHSAAGVTKAALDAQTLAESLAATQHDVSSALGEYERARLDFGRRLVAHARYLGAYLEGRIKPPNERRGHERERDPRQLIRDYGAPNLLHDVDTAPFRTARTGVGAGTP